MASPENMTIELGDVIQLIAPSNAAINEYIYIIDYIDDELIKLINVDTLTPHHLNIQNGNITDESISGINILDKPEFAGYAAQHEYVVGTWLDIYFAGDQPAIITGEITDLENDMIEIKTFPNKKIYYIDFAYKGIPKDLPIEKINIRSKPEKLTQQEQEHRLTTIEEENIDSEIDVEMDESLSTEQVKHQAVLDNIDTHLQSIFNNIDGIIVGDELASVTEVVDLSADKQRFGIEKQTNDLLDDLLSTIPATERTRAKLNDIHTMIERFKQLRNMFSEFDVYGNITNPIVNGAQHKPLVKQLNNFNAKLYWIIPVAVNKRKVFDIDDEISDEISDISSNTLASLRVQEDDIINTYYDNNIPEGQNKYSFLLQNLNKHLTPFDPPTYTENQIVNKPVNVDMSVIIDNQEDFYSSTSYKSDIKRKRFVMQNYNKGITQLELSDKIAGKTHTIVSNIVPGDEISLKSILTLPEPVIRFSHINLPGTNILTKSDLNHHFINYWKYLNEKTFTDTVNIDSITMPSVGEYIQPNDPDKGFSQIREYTYTPSTNEQDHDERYSKFLNKIIPNTKVLFEHFKKYITRGLSVHQVVKTLEPFLIYYDDLTFKQYSEMSSFIQDEINEFKRKFILRGKEFSGLKLTRYRTSYNKPHIIRLLNEMPALSQQVAEYYNIIPSGTDIRSIKQFSQTDSELIQGMLRKDSMRAYMSLISLININLHLDVDIDALITNGDNNPESIDNNCAQFVLSKKYTSLSELQIDNDTPLVYFDRIYDNTRYDILREYKNEMNSMPQSDFVVYLANKLTTTIGITYNNAIREAQSMVDGMRLVYDGDYAVLETINDDEIPAHFYYKRIGNNWQLDEATTSGSFADTNKMFCDTQLPCFNINKECLNKGIADSEVKKQNVENMMKEFEFQYNLSQQELETYTKLQLQHDIKMLPLITRVNQHKILKYSRQQFNIGSDIIERDIIISPNASVRDLILGQSDFVKKQNDIIRFKNSFARSANGDENTFWFYCIETQTKLLPTFIFTLAEAFVGQNIDHYTRILDRTCAERGTVSDDGNSWVDKFSGYEIRSIEFDTDEGFEDSGYKMTSREILEKDAGSHVLVEQEPDKIISEDTYIVHNVIKSVSSFLGVSVSTKIDFITSNTLSTLSLVVGSERSYEDKSAKMLKSKGKGLPPYKDMKNTILLMLSLSYLIVAIQTSIPSIKTRKTFPGCIKSFTGFPMQGNTDMSTVTYIACVANKIKSSVEPWNTFSKHNDKSIAKKIIDLINKHIITNNEINGMMREKLAYLSLDQEDYIPIQHEIINWTTFLPPLSAVKLPTVNPLSSDFESSFTSDIKSGSKSQLDSLNAIKGKITQFSLEIQNNIQEVVNSQDPILTNAAMEPFLANSCCNEDGNLSTIDYFTKRKPDIISDNNYVEKLSNILHDVRFMRIAPFFLNTQDTRLQYPPLNSSFSEETIYRAYIVLCKFNNKIPLDDNLLRVCTDKPKIFDSNWTIKEKIQNLKEQGKQFDNQSLNELMNVINKKNIVNVDLNKTYIDPIQNLRNILEEIDGEESEVISSEFTRKFIDALDTYDTSSVDDSEPMRDFKNYLALHNSDLTRVIINEITEYTTLNKSQKKISITFMENLMSWSDIRKQDKIIENDDSTMFKMATFIKNILNDTISTFPNIIINNVNYKDIKIPRHWSLSERHQSDIKNVLSTYYAGLKQFYGDKDLDPILLQVQSDSADMLRLVNATMMIAKISDLSDINPLLNNELVELLYNYYFTTTLHQFILQGNAPKFTVNDQPIAATSIDENQGDITTLVDQLDSIGVDDNIDINIMKGDIAMIRGKIATLLTSFISIFANTKQLIDFNYESIMDRVLRSKEKEKEGVTQRLKDMTDESREIDTEFKRHKLGDWGKGLEKGLTQYVKETYDQEREALDKIQILESKLNDKDMVTDMNKDIYAMDLENQMLKDNEMEEEAYNMSDVLGENEDEYENDGF